MQLGKQAHKLVNEHGKRMRFHKRLPEMSAESLLVMWSNFFDESPLTEPATEKNFVSSKELLNSSWFL